MTYKISSEALGQIGADGFARHVAERIAVLKEYDAHEAIVRKHAGDPDMAPEDRWVSLAVPQAPVEIDDAIRRIANIDGTTDFVADYEIIGPTLEQKKAKLFDLVSVAEREAIKAVLPAGKIRAYQFREADIRKADQVRYSAAAAQFESIDTFEHFTAFNRPADDTRFLDGQAAREDQRNEIYRWAANLHSDIEDLTEATVDVFEVKPFHG